MYDTYNGYNIKSGSEYQIVEIYYNNKILFKVCTKKQIYSIFL